ncbi:MAG TPA: hypothetical protein VFX98_00050, partial [Longimicrobiaceae bacterium]|nr:hypothetical protein [Longimicrobiaceae bacterium]
MQSSLNPVLLTALLLGACATPPELEMPEPTQAQKDSVDPRRLLRPGVSLELARERAASLSAVRYELALDLTAADSAPGSVRIAFDRTPDAGDLVVDFRGPALARVTANG